MYQRSIRGLAMGWKVMGAPTVRRQRDRWVVRIDGINTETGKHRPRQLGTYSSQRAALAAARSVSAQQRAASRDTVGWLVRRWCASRTDVSPGGRQQYEWAAGHIEAGIGAIRLDRLDREDVAGWLDSLASGGHFSRRSVEICRTVLKAALTDAVDEGLIPRNPAARVPLPKQVAKPARVKEVDAWSENQVERFLAATADHRWAIGFRLGVLYGLRRSELLALRWDDVDWEAGTIRIDEGLIAIKTGVQWSDGKTVRSRRVIALDPVTMRVLGNRRRQQAEERLAAGSEWIDEDMILATRTGVPVLPRSFDRALALIIEKTGLPRLTSHGLRHTAATHMVRSATDVGELRAVADVLGHGPDVLMRVYAHTLPESMRAVTDKISRRAGDS
jgi:integrase